MSGGATALAALSAGRVNIWDYSTGMLVSQLGDTGDVRDVTFSHDGRFVLTGTTEGIAKSESRSIL